MLWQMGVLYYVCVGRREWGLDVCTVCIVCVREVFVCVCACVCDGEAGKGDNIY